MAVSKRLRYEVMRRDGFRCRYCGFTGADTVLQVDHVQPVALGGSDEPENLVTSCADCNAGKSASTPEEPIVASVADDSLRWAKAMEEAAEIKAAEQKKRDSYIDEFDLVWLNWHLGDDPELKIDRPQDWKQTIDQFYNAGLDMDTLLRLVEVAMTKQRLHADKTFRYFCGCCWNVIKERQAIAKALIERDEAGQE